MGFYPPATLVRDAQRHGVEVLPVDVNLSSARCVVERIPCDDKSRGILHAVRIGLNYVSQIGNDEAREVVSERGANGPFRDVADLARRTRLSREALEALVESGACDGFWKPRRDLLWELGLVFRAQSVPGSQGEMKQLPLELEPTAETPPLRDLTRWERMLADYRHTSMSIETHPLALLRPHLPAGTLSSEELHEARHGRQVAFAGMTVARQRPSTAKGVVFMLLEDEFGQVNLVVPSAIYERHRATVRAEPLVLACGRYERVGENRNVLVSSLESLGPLARRVAKDDRVWESLPRPHSFGRR
jgi:error-prone DNA polymerase